MRPCLARMSSLLPMFAGLHRRRLTVPASFVEAHGIYVDHHGSALISVCFTVPTDSTVWPHEHHKRKLGKEAHNFRKQYMDLELPLEDMVILEDIGFAWERGEWTWENKVVPALVAFKKTTGNLIVPRQLVVPSENPWPKNAWGMKLGATCDRIRSHSAFIRDNPERRQWLDNNGFVFDCQTNKWEQTKQILERYYAIHRKLDVPTGYVIPSEGQWPPEMWGSKLGLVVRNIRSMQVFVRDDPKRRQWLDDRGFRFETASSKRPPSEKRWKSSEKLAFVAYKDIYGDLSVPKVFVVPSEEPWPEEAWGVKLGNIISRIRTKTHSAYVCAERMRQLKAMGFVFDDYARRWEETKSALRCFHEMHGHLDVPQRFVVPCEDPWPEDLWKKKLGKTVSHIRSVNLYNAQGDPDRKKWLDEHGMKWRTTKTSMADKVRNAAMHYGRTRTGTSPVPI